MHTRRATAPDPHASSLAVVAVGVSSVGGNMELVPIFGTDFNNFIPILLLVRCRSPYGLVSLTTPKASAVHAS